MVRVGCLGGNGRIDVFLNNVTAATATYSVRVGQLDARVRTLAPGSSVRVSVTGRQDGQIPVVVTRDTISVRDDAVIVACD